MKAILINPVTNVVENIGVWSNDSTRPSDYTVVIVEDDFYVSPGFNYDGTNFNPPSQPDSTE